MFYNKSRRILLAQHAATRRAASRFWHALHCAAWRGFLRCFSYGSREPFQTTNGPFQITNASFVATNDPFQVWNASRKSDAARFKLRMPHS